MSSLTPNIFESNNLSLAWGRAYLNVIDHPKRHCAPMVVSVTNLEDGPLIEDMGIRHALDTELQRHGKFSADVSAMLIFPQRSWLRRGQPNCKDFSQWYLDALLPRLKAREPRRNGKGTYFERMIAASGSKRTRGGQELRVVNQLEHILQIWKRERSREKHPRLSALQVSCFDPVKDHTGAIRAGFPCLQQISFSYEDDRLMLAATYPTEWFFDRAYGNYLGLCHLGFFMAREMGLKFSRLNCFINHPDLGDVSENALKCLTKKVQQSVSEADMKDKESWFNNFELM